MAKLERLIKVACISAIKTDATTAAVTIGAIIGTHLACGKANWVAVVGAACLARIICSLISLAKLIRLKDNKEV